MAMASRGRSSSLPVIYVAGQQRVNPETDPEDERGPAALRSRFMFGAPVMGYSSPSDRAGAQLAEYTTFVRGLAKLAVRRWRWRGSASVQRASRGTLHTSAYKPRRLAEDRRRLTDEDADD